MWRKKNLNDVIRVKTLYKIHAEIFKNTAKKKKNLYFSRKKKIRNKSKLVAKLKKKGIFKVLLGRVKKELCFVNNRNNTEICIKKF